MSDFRNTLFLSAMFVFIVSNLAPAAEPTAKPPVRNVRITYNCEIDHIPDNAEGIDLWVPIATSDDRQTIRLLNEDQLQSGRFTTDKELGNRMYYRHFNSPFGLTTNNDGKPLHVRWHGYYKNVVQTQN